MAQRTRFYDSSASDRVYISSAWSHIYRALHGDTNGVVYESTDTELKVIQDSPAAMSVEVSLGKMFINGYFFEVYTGNETLTIGAADATNPRIDRIVVRRSLLNRTASLVVLEGVPSVTPVAPSITQTTQGTWEEPLAQVYVGAGVVSIVTANITDERVYLAPPETNPQMSTVDGHDHDGVDSPVVPFENLANVASNIEFAADNTYDLGTPSVAPALIHTNNMRVGGNIYQAGTTFPGSPVTNQMYYRTDDDELYFWNGYFWLTTQTYLVHGNISYGASAKHHQLKGDRDMQVIGFYWTLKTGSTHNTSNYYDVPVIFHNTTPSSDTYITVNGGNTYSYGANAWVHAAGSFGTAFLVDVTGDHRQQTNGPHTSFGIAAVPIGSPTIFSNSAYTLRYRWSQT